MNSPLVTVILPHYNSPDLLRAVDSVLFQTYPNVEIVLIDDCSENFLSKELVEYVKTKKSENVKNFIIIENEINLGTVKTINKGIKAAEGEYVFFLACDDVFADEKVLEDWVVEFQRTGALVLTAMRDCYDEKLEIKYSTCPTETQIEKIQTLTPIELFEEIAVANFIFGCCTAYAKQCFVDNGNFDERYRLVDDHPMNLRLLRNGVQIKFFNRVVVKYRSGGVSFFGGFDSVYERDADLIFENEALPYVKKPHKAKKEYRAWKRKRKLDRRLFLAIDKAKGNSARIFFAKVWYHAHNPVNVVRTYLLNPKRLIKVIKKYYKGEK